MNFCDRARRFFSISYIQLYSDAVSGWASWALANPELEVSVNPIQNRGGGSDYAHGITAYPPGFENLTASLLYKYTIIYYQSYEMIS